MSITLAVALAIPWVFWGVVMAFLWASRRSWVNLLLIPAGTSLVLVIAANFSSVRSVFWASFLWHLLLLLVFLVSYVSFLRKERKKKT